MQYFVGTSGYSYKEWKGLFYPKDLPDKDMLQFYSRFLPAVEINNTFYRMPTPAMIEAWALRVPADFRFVLKASRKITHSKPLKDKGDEISYLFRTAALMGDKLGAILFQLPPYMRKDIKLLTDFTGLLPTGTQFIFEFRHRSWFDDELYQLLNDRGCAICCSDSENEELSQLVPTADWGYFRLRRPNYTETELVDWAKKIKSQKWRAVYAFFKHEDDGAGPELAKKFLNILRRSE